MIDINNNTWNLVEAIEDMSISITEVTNAEIIKLYEKSGLEFDDRNVKKSLQILSNEGFEIKQNVSNNGGDVITTYSLYKGDNLINGFTVSMVGTNDMVKSSYNVEFEIKHF